MHAKSPRPVAPPLRWGILSTAGIVRRNWPAMQRSAAAVLAGLASRSPEKAAQFVAELQAAHPWPVPPRVFSSYEELLASPDIDAVYIPLPTGLRKPWVLHAARAGKHVLCEKPCAINATDLREMLDCCHRHGVRFMDGVMFMHDPRYAELRGLLADAVGEVRRISSVFSFQADAAFTAENIRADTLLEPAGCLGDLGWYCLRGALWAMAWEMPVRVAGRVLGHARDAITEFTGELEFAGGATAAFYCSFVTPDWQALEIGGTAGHLRIPDFVSPRETNDVDWEIGFERRPRAGFPAGLSAANMFAAFAAETWREDWPEIAWKTQRVQDACLESARTGQPVFLAPGG